MQPDENLCLCFNAYNDNTQLRQLTQDLYAEDPRASNSLQCLLDCLFYFTRAPNFKQGLTQVADVTLRAQLQKIIFTAKRISLPIVETKATALIPLFEENTQFQPQQELIVFVTEALSARLSEHDVGTAEIVVELLRTFLPRGNTRTQNHLSLCQSLVQCGRVMENPRRQDALMTILMALVQRSDSNCKTVIQCGGISVLQRTLATSNGSKALPLLRCLFSSLTPRNSLEISSIIQSFVDFSLRLPQHCYLLRELVALFHSTLTATPNDSVAKDCSAKTKSKDQNQALKALRCLNLYLLLPPVTACIDSQWLATLLTQSRFLIAVEATDIVAFLLRRNQNISLRSVFYDSFLRLIQRNRDDLFSERKKVFIRALKSLNESLRSEQTPSIVKNSESLQKIIKEVNKCGDHTNVAFEGERYTMNYLICGEEDRNKKEHDFGGAASSAAREVLERRGDEVAALQLLSRLVDNGEMGTVTVEVVQALLGRVNADAFSLEEQQRSQHSLVLLGQLAKQPQGRILLATPHLQSQLQQLPRIDSQTPPEAKKEVNSEQTQLNQTPAIEQQPLQDIFAAVSRLNTSPAHFLDIQFLPPSSQLNIIARGTQRQSIGFQPTSIRNSIVLQPFSPVRQSMRPQLFNNGRMSIGIQSPTLRQSMAIDFLPFKETVGQMELKVLGQRILAGDYSCISPFIKQLRTVETEGTSIVLQRLFVVAEGLRDPLFEAGITVEQFRSRIVESLWQHCQLSDLFYEVLKSQVRLGLRRRNVGVKGTKLLSTRLLASTNSTEILLILKVLMKNIDNGSVMAGCGVIPWLQNCIAHNQQRSLQLASAQLLREFGNLSQMQQRPPFGITLYKRMEACLNDQSLLAALLSVMGASDRCCSDLNTQTQMSFLLRLLQLHSHNPFVVQSFCAMLERITANPNRAKTLLKLGVTAVLQQTLNAFFQAKIHPETALSALLSALSSFAHTPEQAQQLLEGGFLLSCRRACAVALQNELIVLLKSGLRSLIRMVDFKEIGIRKNAQLLVQGDVLPLLFSVMEKHRNTEIVEVVLSLLRQLSCVPALLSTELPPSQDLSVLLMNAADWQPHDPKIHLHWSCLLQSVILRFQPQHAASLLQRGILFKAALYLRGVVFPEPSALSRCVDALSALKSLPELPRRGLLLLAAQLLRKRQLGEGAAQRLFITLGEVALQNAGDDARSQLLLGLLNWIIQSWRLKPAEQALKLLQKLHSSLPYQSSLQFMERVGVFLTLKECLREPLYQRRVRQIMHSTCSLIQLNRGLRVLLNNPLFITILEEWRNLEEVIADGIAVAAVCRLSLTMLDSDHCFLQLPDGSNISPQTKNRLQHGYRCQLYRQDGSHKDAVVRYSPENKCIVAHKPKGQIKSKYSLRTTQVLLLGSHLSRQEISYKMSWFKASEGTLQRGPNPSVLLSLWALNQQSLLHQIHVEFPSQQLREECKRDLQQLISRAYAHHHLLPLN